MVTWKLAHALDSRNLTRYAVQKHSKLPMNTLRAMYDGSSARVDFKVLDRLILALREITGEDIRLGDLVEWTP